MHSYRLDYIRTACSRNSYPEKTCKSSTMSAMSGKLSAGRLLHTSRPYSLQNTHEQEETFIMKKKADLIIKNANIYTVDETKPTASALVVKDGRFAYVGDESGALDYEGEICDMNGRFIMPAMLDSHAHVSCSIPMGVLFKYPIIREHGKKAILDSIAGKVHADKGEEYHYFMIFSTFLEGDYITKEDLDEITTDECIYVLEEETHSGWANSKMLEAIGYDDNSPDPIPGLSYFVRDKEGKLTGWLYEGVSMKAVLANAGSISDEYIIQELKRLNDYCKKMGIIELTECGMPVAQPFGERVYDLIAKLDAAGEWDIYINGSYGIMLPEAIDSAIDEVKRYQKKYEHTKHIKVRTFKAWIDGTSAISTACMLEPRLDNGLTGGRLFESRKLADMIKECDDCGFDVHLHTIGDGAIRMCLDAVETAKKEQGERFKANVTLAHIELCSDPDVPRFAELGVYANFTPWWIAPPQVSGGYEYMQKALGDRFRYEYRIKDIYDAGACVTFGCDQIGFGDFSNWNPFVSMEVGIMRRYCEENINKDYVDPTDYALTPEQSVDIECMIKGYTINGAKQIKEDALTGSITEGKRADFIVLPVDLTQERTEDISKITPDEVYFEGRKVYCERP